MRDLLSELRRSSRGCTRRLCATEAVTFWVERIEMTLTGFVTEAPRVARSIGTCTKKANSPLYLGGALGDFTFLHQSQGMGDGLIWRHFAVGLLHGGFDLAWRQLGLQLGHQAKAFILDGDNFRGTMP